MDTLIHLSWRLYVALPLMVLGAALAVWGTKRELHGLLAAVRGDSAHLVTLMEGFRLSIIGLALAGIGAAWTWHILWLLVMSLVFGGEETLESSMAIYALRRGRRTGSERASGYERGEVPLGVHTQPTP